MDCYCLCCTVRFKPCLSCCAGNGGNNHEIPDVLQEQNNPIQIEDDTELGKGSKNVSKCLECCSAQNCQSCCRSLFVWGLFLFAFSMIVFGYSIPIICAALNIKFKLRPVFNYENILVYIPLTFAGFISLVLVRVENIDHDPRNTKAVRFARVIAVSILIVCILTCAIVLLQLNTSLRIENAPPESPWERFMRYIQRGRNGSGSESLAGDVDYYTPFGTLIACVLITTGIVTLFLARYSKFSWSKERREDIYHPTPLEAM